MKTGTQSSDLKSLAIKKAYSSDFDDILGEFYIPALTQSTEYLRLAGYFSSTSLAVAARGISGLIKNGGEMRLIISPKLSKDDLDIIIATQNNTQKRIEENFLKELEQIENDFEKDHIAALGWMLANDKLKIKVAIPRKITGEYTTSTDADQCGIFHQKVGILRDVSGNIISFSGSINETALGWLNNIEEFKVFRSWDQSEFDYVIADSEKFNRFWNDSSNKVDVIDLPTAVKNRLISIGPKNFEEIDLMKHYKLMGRKGPPLYQHQKDAISKWLNNNMRGIFEMATGTGKTYAALGCISKISEMNKYVITCISCPYQHLIQQWKKEIGKFGTLYDKLIIADSSNPEWKNNLANALMDVSLGYISKLIIITTHDTLSSKNFIKIMGQYKSKSKLFIVADEVHGLGSQERRKGLIGDYEFRLGLSATPKRWFDLPGTKILYEYFGDTIYEFGLEKAINTINPDTGKTYLAPYRYNIKFASLSEEELEDYITKTAKIMRLWKRKNSEDDQNIYLEQLLFGRANIIKNAESKYEEFKKILKTLPSPIKYTLVYCSPQQIEIVMKLLKDQGIYAHRFTMEEGTTPSRNFRGLSEREYLLEEFSKGKYQALVAMRCLDEGVDVPPARTAILLSSSGNPREYIQRIGRVIRRFQGKLEATIYDIVVIPNLTALTPEIRDIEKKIIEKELTRYEEISKHAINNAEALSAITSVMLH
jgi:superfamily II DNA or RNA helicase